MKKEINYSTALMRCMSLCSMGEKCENDIQKKLQDWGLLNSEIDQIIDQLIAEKYLDNDRFCGAYIRDKFRYSGWGRIKIAYHLKEKKIPSSLIQKNLIEHVNPEEYLTSLKHLLEMKNKRLSDTDRIKRKEKLIRFALSRGFEFDIILSLDPFF